MTDSVRHPPVAALARSLSSIFVVAMLATVVVACGSGRATSTTPTAPAAAAARSAPAPKPAATAGTASAAGQTDTDWGRIWDTLPKGFPSVPGATTADETATGPASADLVVPGSDAKAVATRMQGLLGQAGCATVGLSGPLENGGYVLDMTGPPAGCQLQVAASPTGSLTTVTILYGASCPHD